MLVPDRLPGSVNVPPSERKVNGAVPVAIGAAGIVRVVPATRLTVLLAPLVSDAIVRAFASRILMAPPATVTGPAKSLPALVNVTSLAPALMLVVPPTVKAAV